MAFQQTEHNYGTRPWQHMTRYASDIGTAPKPWILWVAGGGWGLRDERVMYDPTNAAGPAWWGGAIARSESAHEETFTIFAVHIASVSHNGTQLTAFSGEAAWDVAEVTIPIDAIRVHDGVLYYAAQAHDASAGTEPGTGGGAAFWVAHEINDPTQARTANRGESQPAFGNQAIWDVHQAAAYIKANAAEFGIDPDLGAWAGDSAGGFDVARAAATGSIGAPYGTGPGAAHIAKPYTSTLPKALLLGITPTYIDSYITVDRGVDQNITRTLLRSIYGRPELFNFADWAALSPEVKKSVDPVRLMEATGYSFPTYLAYTEGPNHTLETDDQTFNGTGSGDANYHGSNNGWRFLERLTRPLADGGQGRTDCVFVEDGTAADTVDKWTLHADHGGTRTVVPATAAALRQTVGEDQLTWLTGILGI